MYWQLTRDRADLPFVNLEELAPYFRSPAFRRLREAIARLGKDEQSDLLALGWLGRGYDGMDWEPIRQRAGAWVRQFTDDSYMRYIAGLTHYLEAGQQLLAKRTSPAPSSEP